MRPNESEEIQGDVPSPKEMPEPEAAVEVAPDVETAQQRADVLPEPAAGKLERTRASGWWAGLIIAAVVLIFLLIFIVQNLESVDLDFLMFSGNLPLGVAMLLAAIGGILMVAIPGIARMIQLRRHNKR